MILLSRHGHRWAATAGNRQHGELGYPPAISRAFKGIPKLVEAQGTSRAEHVRQISCLIFHHAADRFPGWMGKDRGDSRPSTDATEQVSLSSLVVPNPACLAVCLSVEPAPPCWTSRSGVGYGGTVDTGWAKTAKLAL